MQVVAALPQINSQRALREAKRCLTQRSGNRNMHQRAPQTDSEAAQVSQLTNGNITKRVNELTELSGRTFMGQSTVCNKPGFVTNYDLQQSRQTESHLKYILCFSRHIFDFTFTVHAPQHSASSL